MRSWCTQTAASTRDFSFIFFSICFTWTLTVLSVMSWDYLEFGNVQNAAIIGILQTLILIIGILVGRYVLRVRLSQAA